MLNRAGGTERGRPPPSVLFLTRSLGRGGAERQLANLAAGLHGRGWPVAVACFYAGGPLQAGLEAGGVRVIDLRKSGRWDVAAFLWRLLRLLRRERPKILHGYLPMPNLLAFAMGPLVPGVRVVWGVRASNMDLSRYDWLERLSYAVERRFARYADLIIANSEAGARLRVAQGFPEEKIRVVANGIDTERFRFAPDGRRKLRTEWEIPEETVLVGLVGRLDPMKDHPTFLEAAAVLSRADATWRFVCVGDGPNEYKALLRRQANAMGLGRSLVWAGPRDDMAAVYSALDIACSPSSFGEGFQNVVAEAMACGRPCVVTDVGDAEMIVGDLGIVVPPRDPRALAAGLRAIRARLETEGNGLSSRARERIVRQFSVETLVSKTAELLLALDDAQYEVHAA